MNKLEKERVIIGEILTKKYSAVGYKASFEDEGANLEDISSAKIVTEKVGLDLCIKVGGCEAIADIKQAKILGAKVIVAPMIETAFALKKFISAIKKVYNEEELGEVTTGINVESITGIENIEKIMQECEKSKIVKRVMIGRSDLVASMEIEKSEINNNLVFDNVKKVLKCVKEYGLQTGMGGGITVETIQFIKDLGDLLDFYETRYIIFENSNKSEKEMAEGIINAQKFEVNYLEDVANKYKELSLENMKRHDLINERIINAERNNR